jgi:hypothetical protein
MQGRISTSPGPLCGAKADFHFEDLPLARLLQGYGQNSGR